jgi:CRISPR-associated protein Cas1
MLSLPDFKEKQVLFIRTERGVSNNIRFLNDNIVFSKDGKVISRVSCHKVFAVFVLGDITITSGLMKDGKRHGVSFFFLKDNLETYASINATVEGHVVLRQQQYQLADAQELQMAKALIANKIENQCALLAERGMKDGLFKDQNSYFAKIKKSKSHDSLRGIEGSASRAFFQEFYKDLRWHRRAPRSKEDIPNVLLDIGYTMLFNCVESLLRLHGFDTYKGFYHKLFFQRKSLACDIMEPMRSIIDRELLKMHNLKRINDRDFKIDGNRYLLSYVNSKKYTEIFLQAIMDRKVDLYQYVHEYYRHVIRGGDEPFPKFNIEKL